MEAATAGESMSDNVPTMVSSEPHGRLGLSALSHGVDPAVTVAGQIAFVLACVTLVIVVVDVVTRGRLRKTSLASAYFLTCISPIIAVYAASIGTLNQWGMLDDQPVPLSHLVVINGGFALMMGSLSTGLGVVLTLVLKLDDAWRGRKATRPDREAKPG